MIKLINEQDIKMIPSSNTYRDSDMIYLKKNISEILKDKIKLGAEKHELIYTGDLRGIGKTYQLFLFAKTNNYLFIIKNKQISRKLRQEYDYHYIYSESDLELGSFINKNVVIDEMVDYKKVKNLGFNIITGFSNQYIDGNKSKFDNIINNSIKIELKDFNENVVEFLKREEDILQKKADKMLENHDFPMYTKIIMHIKLLLN